MNRTTRLVMAAALLGGAAFAHAATGLAQTAPAAAKAPIDYKITFPAPEHHWLQVEATFPDLGTAPLKARMSRSSPGRYAVHEFAKNVFWLEAYDGKGHPLNATRPNVDEWDIAGHDGTVRIVYKLFGDHADGTYMGVDTTHAHLNMPATFMWAVGHDMQPEKFTFTPPANAHWKIATQLFPTADPWTFTSPNLQYMMDSPTELADLVMGHFTLPNADGTPATFRLAVHGDGTQADVDALATLVQRLLREQMAVFGEFPKYEPGYYTFLLDYSPFVSGDGMEHRNSTSISQAGETIRGEQGRMDALGTISHEFFHNWNVERIRPAGLEPFDFTRENITCCLWLAEGFTQYYGPLLQTRAGLTGGGGRAGGPPGANNAIAVINGSGRTVRSAVQMSEYGPFNDAAQSIDLNDGSRTFISYYTYGAAIAFGLDLSLRDISDGKVSLDDFMRAMWTGFGKPGGPAPGLVGRPYALKDLRDTLAAVSGNRKFADDFFDKYVEGREVVDYARLLRRAGYILRAVRPETGWIGNAQVAEGPGGLLVGTGGTGGTGGAGRGGRVAPVNFNTPLYDAGVDEGDTIAAIDGAPATMAAWSGLSQKKPGDHVTLRIIRRDGAIDTATATLKADPALQIVPVESTGGTLTDAERSFRAAWLGAHAK